MGWQNDPVVTTPQRVKAWDRDPVVESPKPKSNLKASINAGVADLIGGPGDMVTAALQKSALLGTGVRSLMGLNSPAPVSAPATYPSDALRQGAGMLGVDATPDENYWQQWPIRFGVSSLFPGKAKANAFSVGAGTLAGTLFAGAKEVAPDNAMLQTAAALSPMLAHNAVTGGIRKAARGGEEGRKAMEANIASTERTMGEAGPLSTILPTGNRRRVAGWLEQAMGYVPGAGFAVREKAERIQAGMGESLRRTSANATDGPYSAGNELKSSLFGDSGYIGRFEAQGDTNYSKAFSHWGKGEKFSIPRFSETVKELAGRFSTEQLSAVFGNPKFAQWAEAIDPSSVGPESVSWGKTTSLPGDSLVNAPNGDPMMAIPGNSGVTGRVPVPKGGRPGAAADSLFNTPKPLPELTFADAKQIRSRLGKLIGKPELVSGFDKAELERLYGALSEDVKLAAWKKGGTAYADWMDASNHWSAGRQDIAKFLEPIKNMPDEVLFETLMSPKAGYDRIQNIRRMVGYEKFDNVVDTLTARMGTPTPGRDLFGNPIEEKFSSETFLTRYNQMPNNIKGAVFGYGERRKALDELAKSSSLLREGKGTLANPSGTAGAGLAGLLLKQAAGAAVTLGLGDLATLGGTTALSYAGAKMLLSPKFAKWLARSNQIPPGSLPAHIQRLRLAAQNAGDKDMEAIADYLAEQNQ